MMCKINELLKRFIFLPRIVKIFTYYKELFNATKRNVSNTKTSLKHKNVFV